jgi:hypothetical protein
MLLMKAARLAELVLSNAVILAMLWAVLQDDSGRLAYFRSLGFTTSTQYYPFFYATSAVNGTTHIGGLLTLDWVQILVAALIIIDGLFLVGLLRKQRQAPVAQPSSDQPPQAAEP